MTPRYAPTSLPLARLTQTFNIHFYAEKQKLPLGHSRVTGGTFLLIVYNFAAKFYVFFVGIPKVLIPKQKCTHSFIFIT
jgi:hypothetical protein